MQGPVLEHWVMYSFHTIIRHILLYRKDGVNASYY